MYRHAPLSAHPPFSKIFSKTAGPIEAKFHVELHGLGELKFVRGIWVTWPRWPPRPYMVKILQKYSREPKGQWPWALVCSIGALGPSKCVQMMTLGWPWPILWQGQIWSLMLLYGKNYRKSFNGRNSKWPEWHEVYVYIKILTPGGYLPLPRGYVGLKTSKNVYKIRL